MEILETIININKQIILVFCIGSKGNNLLNCYNLFSKEVIVFHIYKNITNDHVEYYIQIWALEHRHGNWNLILRLDKYKRKLTKIIKKVKI